MTTPVPPSPGELDASGYPVLTTFTLPDRVARWRPLLHWLLVIPHLVVLWVLNLVASVLVVVLWFTGVFAGKAPRSLLEVVAMYLRYGNRVFTYVLFLRGDYPPFEVDAALPDSGRDRTVRLDVVPATEGRSRLTIFFRGLLVILHAVVLFFLGIAMYVAVVVGFFAVLVLGRWPAGLRDFVERVVRWVNRVNAYSYLLTDEFPPFRLS